MRIALDTNILVRTGNPDDPRHGALHGRLAEALREGHELCIAAQCLYELWVVVTRPVAANGLGLSPDEAQAAIQRAVETFVLLADPPDLLTRWLYLCVRHRITGRLSHDTRIVAWMIANHVDRLYTLNPGDFTRFDEIALLEHRSSP